MTGSRLYQDRPFLAASVAVVRKGQVLLAARTKPPLDHVFSLPGGAVELGETLAEAALRELAEEVGVTAEIVGFVAPLDIVERDEIGRVRHHFVVMSHAARWIAGEGSVGDEAREVRWVTPAEAAGLSTTPGLVPILERALALVRSAAEGI